VVPPALEPIFELGTRSTWRQQPSPTLPALFVGQLGKGHGFLRLVHIYLFLVSADP